MNHDTERLDLTFDRRIADWLEADMDLAPHEVLDTVLSAMPSIPQRRPRGLPGRSPAVPTRRRAAMAAVLGVLLLGGAFVIYQRPSSEGGRGVPASASPSATLAPSPSQRATPASISGSWRPEPLAVPAELLAAAAASCRQEFTPVQSDLGLVISDVRGAALGPGGAGQGGKTVAYLGFYRSDGRLQDCFISDLTGSSAEVARTELSCCFRAARPEPLHLAWATRTAPALVGRVGEGIVRVRIDLDDGTMAFASIRDDWFAIYLPDFDAEAVRGYRAVGLDAEGNVVTTLQATETAPLQGN